MVKLLVGALVAGAFGAGVLLGPAVSQDPAQAPAKPAAAKSNPAQDAPAKQAEEPAKERKPADLSGLKQEDPEQAILAMADLYTTAFNDGDVDTILELYEPNARLVSDTGEITEGRDEIAELYANTLAETPGLKVELTVDSIEKIAEGVVVEDGTSSLIPPDGGPAEVSRYTVVHVRKDGRWFMASVRDFPADDPTPEECLKPLEWMVGEWVNEDSDNVIFTTCRWSDDKNFLLREYTLQREGKPTLSGTQRIAWDPAAKQIRSWVFDSFGGFGEEFWSHDQERWVIKATKTMANGQRVTGTHILSPEGKDRWLWQTVDRTIGEDASDEIKETVLVRRPPKPAAE